jgi:putative N-acetylmannosamine-6-phosphate epimerase
MAAFRTPITSVALLPLVAAICDVATAFGVFLNGVDIISTIPSNANDGAVANDDAGKIGATLGTNTNIHVILHCRDWVVILSVVKRDFTNSPTYKCVKYIINIAFDGSFAQRRG